MRRSPSKRKLFCLAAKLGEIDPYKMVRHIPAKLLIDWEAYMAIEPFDEVRADYRSAQIVQMLYNINRDSKKDPNGRPLSDFLLQFDDPESPEEKQIRLDKELANKMRVFELIARAKAEVAVEARLSAPGTHEHFYPAVDGKMNVEVLQVVDDDRVQRALAAARAASRA